VRRRRSRWTDQRRPVLQQLTDARSDFDASVLHGLQLCGCICQSVDLRACSSRVRNSTSTPNPAEFTSEGIPTFDAAARLIERIADLL